MTTKRTMWVLTAVSVALAMMIPAVSSAVVQKEENVVIIEETDVKAIETVEETVSETKCMITFNLKGWSIFYRRLKGEGEITCDNGQRATVKLSAHGGGITFGKQEIKNGHGTFTRVRDISELFGSYATSEAHAGAKKSANAQAMTKGKVSLAFSGTGRGYDVGFSFGGLSITPVEGMEENAARSVEKTKGN